MKTSPIIITDGNNNAVSGLYRGALDEMRHGEGASHRSHFFDQRQARRRKTRSLPASGALISQCCRLLTAKPFAARLGVWANQVYGIL